MAKYTDYDNIYELTKEKIMRLKVENAQLERTIAKKRFQEYQQFYKNLIKLGQMMTKYEIKAIETGAKFGNEKNTRWLWLVGKDLVIKEKYNGNSIELFYKSLNSLNPKERYSKELLIDLNSRDWDSFVSMFNNNMKFMCEQIYNESYNTLGKQVRELELKNIELKAQLA